MLHDVSMWAQRLLHSDNKKYTLSLFEKELQHAQNVSRRENIRDTMVQESQRAQAIMIVDTLMFGCCYSLIVEGNLPDGTQETVVVAFSISLTISVSFLIISVWFAMNLQSRIVKYDISDKTVKYGKQQKMKSTFRKYFLEFCKPVYRLTHWFMWMGTVALLIAGTLLVCAKFVYTHKSESSCGIFIIGTSLCILALAIMLHVWDPKVRRVKLIDDEDMFDFSEFRNFIETTGEYLKKHDHECEHCSLPIDIFQFCPKTGQKHPMSSICRRCNMSRDSMPFCPTTGEPHGDGGAGPRDVNPLNMFHHSPTPAFSPRHSARPGAEEAKRRFVSGSGAPQQQHRRQADSVERERYRYSDVDSGDTLEGGGGSSGAVPAAAGLGRDPSRDRAASIRRRAAAVPPSPQLTSRLTPIIDHLSGADIPQSIAFPGGSHPLRRPSAADEVVFTPPDSPTGSPHGDGDIPMFRID